MSDEPDRPRVVTAPLGVTPAAAPETTAPVTAKLEPAPANARPATQMSASAVPSTLESPHDPAAPPVAAAALETATTLNAFDPATTEINGAYILRGDTVRDDAAHVPATPAAEGTVQESRRAAPATMVSPAVIAPLPGESTPPLAPEQAVVDVGAPAHAFVPYGSGAPPGYGGPHGMMRHGSAGPGRGGAAERRPMSTTFVLLLVGGTVAALALLAVAVIGLVFFTRRRAAEGDGSRGPTITVTPASPDAPRLPPRMGGPRARVTLTTTSALDTEAVRAAVTAALPRLDACFAGTELDPPNHEVTNYDLDVAPNGEIRRAEPSTPGPRSQKLDTCVVQNLRSIRMPRSTKASTVKLTFFAPIEPR